MFSKCQNTAEMMDNIFKSAKNIAGKAENTDYQHAHVFLQIAPPRWLSGECVRLNTWWW